MRTVVFSLVVLLALAGRAAAEPDRGPPLSPPPVTPPVAAPRRVAISFENWAFWYHHHADRLEAETAPQTREPLKGLLAPRRDAILSALRSAVERSPKAWQTANACRALGRVSDARADEKRLADLLEDPSREPLAREGAALGLGFRPRSEGTRKALRAVADDAGNPTRLRGLAMLSLGLLGEPLPLTRLETMRQTPEMPAALLHARALHLAAPLASEERTLLTRILTHGKVGDESVGHLTRAFAAQALGALGGEEDVNTLTRLLGRRRVNHNVKRSAALALGRLAPRLPPAGRARLGSLIENRLDTKRDATTRQYLLMALVPLLTAGPPPEVAALLPKTPADNALRRKAARGRYMERSYAALALGFLLRTTDETSPHRALRELHARALKVLRDGFQGRKMGTNERAAFALALGFARDEEMVPVIRSVAADARRDGTLRGYALLALPFVAPDIETHRLARRQLARPGAGFHGRAATRVLGMTGDCADTATVALLARGLRMQAPGIPSGEAAVALARIGTVEAADALLAVAVDPRAPAIAVSMALAGLGRIADPEPIPALCRVTEGLNHRASTDLVNEVLGYY